MQYLNDQRRISLACVALAAFCWGIAGGISGILTANGWSPSIITFYRGGIGFIIMLCWLVLCRDNVHIREPGLWLWGTIAGFGVAGNLLFYVISIEHGSVAVAATLMYCAPIYVYLVAFFLGMEGASLGKLLKIACSLIGIVLLTEAYNPAALSISAKGGAAGLLSGVCYAIFIFGFKSASHHGRPQTILTVAFGVLLLSVACFGNLREVEGPIRSADWSLFLALGVLGAGLSFLLYVEGVRGTAPTLAAIVALIEPITASLFSVLLLGEQLAPMQLVGMALILVAVTSLSVSRGRSAKPNLAQGSQDRGARTATEIARRTVEYPPA